MTYRLLPIREYLELYHGYQLVISCPYHYYPLCHIHNMPQTARSGVDFTQCADTIRKAWLNTLP